MATRREAIMQALQEGSVKAVVDMGIDKLADKSIDGLKALGDAKQYAVLGGEYRREVKFIQDNLLQAFPDSVKSQQEPGTMNNPTQQIVTDQIKGTEGREASKGMSLQDLRDSAAAHAAQEPEQSKEQDKGQENDQERGME